MRKTFYFDMKWMKYDKFDNTIFSKCSAKIYWIIDYHIENNLISKMVQFWRWLEPPFSLSSVSITTTRSAPPPFSATRSFAISTFRTSGTWPGKWSMKYTNERYTCTADFYILQWQKIKGTLSNIWICNVKLNEIFMLHFILGHLKSSAVFQRNARFCPGILLLLKKTLDLEWSRYVHCLFW